MIIVTGGAGFIGSNLVHMLNQTGRDDIVIVDDLTDGKKFRNIATARIADYLDREEFRLWFNRDRDPFDDISYIYHLGACSDTTEWDGHKMLDLNYSYARDLIRYATKRRIPVLYASSAAVYGQAEACREHEEFLQPLNVYAYSKRLLDDFVRRQLSQTDSQLVGLRYFNVYGPREQHKQNMASVVYHFNRQLLDGDRIKLFDGSHGYAAGEQRRDFVYVDDVVRVGLWFAEHPDRSGIFNCGSGRAETFNRLAQAVLAWHGRGTIEYIPFPPELLVAYQSHTQADPAALRATGCDVEFRSIDDGVPIYLDWLNA